jgi:hypothetical protein
LHSYGKSKGSLASKIPKSVQYSYDDCIKLMVIIHAKAASDCATVWGLFLYCKTEYMTFKKTELLLKGANVGDKNI